MKSFSIKICNETFTHENYREIIDLNEKTDKKYLVNIIEFLNEWLNNKKYIVVNTSGSTGKPKKINLPKESMLFSAQKTCTFFNLTSQDNALLCLPVDYIAGKMMLVRAIVSQMNLYVSTPKSNPFEDISEQMDFVAITPFQLSHSIASITNKKIKTIIVGGASISKELECKIQNIPSNVYETYGMTETCSHIALKKINGENSSEYFNLLDGIKISLDQRHCLVIDAPTITIGPITTNDIVEIKDGKYFKWIGRADSVINSGGIKIFPEHIENRISGFIDRTFFISSEPDDLLGEKTVLILEGNPLNPDDEKELMQKIARSISRYEMPSGIKYMNKIELTETKKIKR